MPIECLRWGLSQKKRKSWPSTLLMTPARFRGRDLFRPQSGPESFEEWERVTEGEGGGREGRWGDEELA